MNDDDFDIDSGSLYIEGNDGVWVRVGEVPDSVKKDAEARGKKLLPDRITPEELERLDMLREHAIDHSQETEDDYPIQTQDSKPKKNPGYLFRDKK